MRELTKAEKRQAKELIQRGILRRHIRWQSDMRKLLDTPIDYNTGNEFDRSMEITARSRKFYNEAMQMEKYCRTSMLPIGLLYLFSRGYLNADDIACLPEDIRHWIEDSLADDTSTAAAESPLK